MLEITHLGVAHQEPTRRCGRQELDRAPPVRGRWYLRDDGLVIERMDGSAGSKKIPAQGS